MVEDLVILALVVLTLLTVFRLWFANLKKTNRYKQAYAPILALIYVGVILYIYNKYWVNDLEPFFWAIFVELDITLHFEASLLLFIFSLVTLLVFPFFKGLTYLIEPTLKRFEWMEEESFLGKNIFYTLEEKGIRLKPEFIIPRELLYALCILAVSIVCLGFFSVYWGDYFPAFILLFLLPFLEFFWYLGGPEPKDLLSRNPDEDPKEKSFDVDYLNLWEKYQQVWGGYFITAIHIKEEYQPPTYFDIDPNRLTLFANTKYYQLNEELIANIKRHFVSQKNIILFVPQGKKWSVKEDYALDYYEKIKKTLLKDFRSEDIAENEMDVVNRKIYLTCPEDFLENTFSPTFLEWMENLGFVIFVDFDKMLLQYPDSTVSVSKILKGKSKDNIQFVVLCEDSEQIQSSVKANLSIGNKLDEYRFVNNRTQFAYFLLWKAEERFEDEMFIGDVERMGQTVALSMLGLQEGIPKISLVNSWGGYQEGLEELTNHRGSWINTLKEELKGIGNKEIQNRYQNNFTGLLLQQENKKFQLLYDYKNNAPHAFLTYADLGQVHSFLQVVSPPHLFRTYFSFNFEFFYQNPRKPLSLIPISQYPLTLALSLVEILTVRAVPLEELEKMVMLKNRTQLGVIQDVEDILREELDVEIKRYIRITKEPSSVPSEYVWKMALDRQIIKEIQFFKPVIFKDDNQEMIYEMRKNLLYQKYLPGQYHHFNGRLYRIDDIIEDEKEIRISLSNREPDFDFLMYHSDLDISLQGEKEIIQSSKDNKIHKTLYNQNIHIQSKGYYELQKGYDLGEDHIRYETFSKPFERNYKHGRFLDWTFIGVGEKWSTEVKSKVNFTLAVLIEEALKSFYPYSHDFIRVLPKYFKKSTTKLENAQKIEKFYGCDENRGKEETLGVYVIEDSYMDKGHLISINDNIRYILETLEDYISWFIEQKTDGDFVVPQPIIQYTNRFQDQFAFLGLGLVDVSLGHDEKLPECFDLIHLRSLLQYLLGNKNKLKESRHSFYGISGDTKSPFNDETCDFCGKTHCTKANAKRLPDGRIICNDCDLIGVKDKMTFNQLLKEALTFMEDQFGLYNWPTIDIQFTDARVIAKARGMFFRPTKRYDMRAVGLASQNGDGFTIHIENNRSKVDTCSTIIHELTHIWQFNNTHYDQMKKEYGKLYIEGHATWAQVQYYKAQNEKSFVKQLGKRDDEYGNGYRLLLMHMAGKNSHDAFEFVKGKYGK